jgi:hypothetical protein
MMPASDRLYRAIVEQRLTVYPLPLAFWQATSLTPFNVMPAQVIPA